MRLAARVERRWADARAHLEPVPAEERVLEDAGVRFVVRVAPALARKPARPGPADPFLPYDEALHVADLSATHVCLFNKYPVLDRHLLLVTRAFVDQEAPLGDADFAALAAVLGEIDGLGFYNAGPIAGASQRHRHLQVVPLPLARSAPGVPIAPLVARAVDGVVPAFRFAHRVAPADDPPRRYREMLAALDLRASDGRLPPYDLLVTRAWMLLVPRARERFEGVSVNALGFAGSLLVTDEAAFARVAAAGPLAVLAAVARP